MMTEKTTQRIAAIDLARGVSVLMLVVIHTLWMYGNVYTQESTWLGHLIHFIGKGTPMFLIAMGISFTLSRNQSIKLSIKRGLILLGLGYLTNFLKFVVPVLIGIMPENFIAAYGWTAPPSFNNMVYMVLTGDILQLAGVSLLFMGIINKYAFHRFVPLVIALVIMMVSQELRGIHVGIAGLDYVLDLLWGQGWNVYFALFPWFSFILIGMSMGLWFNEKGRDLSFIFTRMLWVGIAFAIIGGSACAYDFTYHFGDYFHLGPGGALYLAGFNLILYWGAHKLVTYAKPNQFFEFLFYSSKRVTMLYIIQWVIVCWGIGIFGYQQLGTTGVLVLIPVLTAVTYLVQAQLEKIFHIIKLTKRAVSA